MSEEEVEKEVEEKPGYDARIADKYGYIDWDKPLDEQKDQIQKRFDSLYSSHKESKEQVSQLNAVLDQMSRDNRKAFDKIEEFQSQIVSGQEEARIQSLREELKTASEEGDSDKIAEVTEKIIEAKAKPVESKPESEDLIPETHQREFNQWAKELDDQGNPKRPWTQQGHPYQEAAALAAATIQSLPKNRGKSPSQWLDQVDEHMAMLTGEKVEMKKFSPVMKSNKDVSAKAEKSEMSEAEKAVAMKMYPAMKPADAVKRYEKSKKALT